MLQSAVGETTGFGLFSLRERLECLAGSLTIASQAGGGTRVVLIAPVDSALDVCADATAPLVHARIARKQPPDCAAVHAIRVMLVDDHTIVREGLRGIVEDEKDMQVVAEAEDGAKAVDLARRLQPEFPNIRVIGLSFHDRDDMASAMRRAGACDYVSKDAASEILCDSIRAQMQG